MKQKILNNDVGYTTVNQLWKLFSGILLLILVPLHLTPEAQGYWYTFISLAALVFFADMGFSTISLQFAAHEFAHLKFLNKIIVGDELRINRLASLWKFSKRFSIAMALVVMPLILIYGYIVLNKNSSIVDWKLPWLLYSIASIFVFINGMIFSFIEGCDSVGEVQKIRFQMSFITVITTVILLLLNAEIFSLSLSLLVGAVSGTVIVFIRFRKMLSQLNSVSNTSNYSWWIEVKPLIWRYAVSWTCGYFIFSIFTPIAFIYFGVIEAGKVGFSISVCTAIFSVSNIWIITITPKINMLIARRQYAELNILFKRNLFLSIWTYIISASTLFIGIAFLGRHFPFVDRLLSPFSLGAVAMAWFLQIVISACAVYMRAHKEEPLMIYSIVSAIYIGITTVVLAKFFPKEFYFFGFLSSYLFAAPWVILLFFGYARKRNLA